MGIADFIQAAQANIPLLLLAAFFSLGSALFLRWLDRRQATAERNASARMAATQAADEASAAIRIANIEDQAKYRQEQAERIRELEDRWDRSNQECQAQIRQLQADRERDLSALRAEQAHEIAEVQAGHATQIAALHGENAYYKEKVASLEADNHSLWDQVHGLGDRIEQAGNMLRSTPQEPA